MAATPPLTDLDQLLQQLYDTGGSPAPSTPTAASIPAIGSGGSQGAALGNLINPAFGINSGPGSAEGGAIGGDVGSLIGMLFGPLGSAIGGFGGGLLGDILGGWIGGGLPTEAKTAGLGQAALASGNPLDALIGKFIGREVNAGNPLSQSGGSTAEEAVQRFAAIIQAITGQGAPSVTATGFQNNPTLGFPSLGKALQTFRLPAGYQFSNDPSKLADIYKDVSGAVNLQEPSVRGKPAQEEWQRILRELIQQGAITKYQGPLGAVGGGGTSPGAIPNLSLPHPLANTANPAATQAPYPV